ncbi:MAG: VOC family protein [Deltaproteobacteria bacterium]|nr:VOC family protein [Deltaproteobacteria bacterium]
MEKLQFPISENIKKLLALPPVSQIGIIVQDMDRAIRYYSELFGLGPWRVFVPEYTDKTYRGRPAQFRIQVALADFGSLEWEFIKVLQGPTVYEDDLGKDGEGLHHVGFLVDNIDERVDAVKKIGIDVIQSGRRPGAKFVYLDTRFIAGVTLEFIQRDHE